jgi:hypothetical protein
MTQNPRDKVLLALDGAGAVCVVGLAFASVWLVFLRSESPASTIKILSGTVDTLRTDLGKLQLRRDEQAELLLDRRAELARIGTIPTHVALDEYFHTLAAKAAAFGLQVRGQQPLTPRVYPGVLEQRYTWKVAGSLSSVARFLRSVEESEMWADVSHLRVAAEHNSNPWATANRAAELTISLLTALPDAVNPAGTQGQG